MTKAGKALIVTLAGATFFSLRCGAVVTSSDAQAASSNPFQGIIDRNVFGLKPPPGPPDPDANKPPPPKITPTGITTLLGKRALFKVQMPAKPPKPAGEESFMLGEGQREGEIEVLEIDEKAGTIKFNNYGTVVTLSLDKDGAKLPNTPPMAVPVPAPVQAGFGGVNPAAPGGQPMPGGAAVTTIGSPAGNLKSIPTRTLRLPNASGGNPGYVPAQTPIQGDQNVQGVQPQSAALSNLTPEEQMIIIEAQREHAKSTANPVSRILPPTPLSPPNPNAGHITPPLPQ